MKGESEGLVMPFWGWRTLNDFGLFGYLNRTATIRKHGAAAGHWIGTAGWLDWRSCYSTDTPGFGPYFPPLLIQ